MSFDLFVWHEQDPITAAEARTKLERWSDGEVDVFSSNPAVARFYDEVLHHFPPLESFTDEDIDQLGVWSMTPERSESIVAASCVWSRADEVSRAIVTLAADNGLICYEPGYHIVNPNAPGHRAAFTLSSECLPTMPDRAAWHGS